MIIITVLLTTTIEESVFRIYIYDVAVIELLVDSLKKNSLIVRDELMFSCLNAVERALNFDLFASDDFNNVHMQTGCAT